MRRRQKQTYTTLREMEIDRETDKEKLRHTDRQAEKDFYIQTDRERQEKKN